MKNEMPPVTSTYFIALIKAYLQGGKTGPEIFAETAGILPLDHYVTAATHTDVTWVLTEAARDMNEDFYSDIVTHLRDAHDTAPTRAGAIRQLQAFLDGDITEPELLEWATWHNMDELQTSAGIFDDLAVEYFCLDFLPTYHRQLSPHHYQQALQLLRLHNGNPLKEKIALVLLLEKEQQNFLFFLRNYLDTGRLQDTLDLYLMKKFGMDHHSFPYMAELQGNMKLEALLQKARLISAHR